MSGFDQMPKETNKEKALTALLEAKSIAEAAKLCGMSEKTLRRYLQEDDFKKDYREARKLIFEQNVMELQTLHTKAIETLEKKLSSRSDSVAVRAAAIVIMQTRKDYENTEILERVEAIEDALKEQNQKD